MVEVPVDRVEAALLEEGRLIHDGGIAYGLFVQGAADAVKPLLLLGAPGLGALNPCECILNASGVGNKWVAHGRLADEADNVGRNVGITHPPVGAAQFGLGEALLVQQGCQASEVLPGQLTGLLGRGREGRDQVDIVADEPLEGRDIVLWR